MVMSMGYSLFIDKLHKNIKNKTVLNNINLNINSGTFTAIVGVSGAGKTTLLNAITGYDPKYEGNIYYDNYNLKNNNLKDVIAYVPQEEILHTDLTLYKEMYYKAKLKIKDKKQIKSKIKETVKKLGLEGKENTKINNLSGGEKKRLSVALELLNNPQVLILDEPTSGLDLNIEKHLMQLLKKIKEQGTTVIITIHTVSNLELCDEIIFMGQNGSICYQGKYESAIEYFNVNKFVEIYELLTKQTPYYNQKYNDTYQKPVIKQNSGKIKIKHSILKDTVTLAQRYIEIISKNHFFVLMLFMQGFIIALLANCAMKPNDINNYEIAKIILFTATCAAMWTGIFNTIQEIVKERQIIKKEYISGVNITSYVLSKILVVTIICLVQALLYITTMHIHFNFIKEGIVTNYTYLDNLITFFLVSFSASMLGLFISSIARKTEITLIFATIYMMMQLILSGVLLKLDGIIDKISHLVIGRYGVECFGTISNMINIVKHTKLNDNIDETVATALYLDEAKEYYTYTSAHVIDIWVLLVVVSLILIFLTITCLKINIKNNKN